MSKFNMLIAVVLFLAASAGCLAHPGVKYLPAVEEHVEYTPTVVGHELHSIPTAVSHQSQTIVHEKRPYLRPIIEHAPIINTYTPIVKTYAEPYVKSYAPILNSYPHSVGWPGAVTYGEPVVYSGLYDHGWAPGLKSVYDAGWSSAWKPSYGDWEPWGLKK